MLRLCAAVGLAGLISQARGQVVFTDTFDTGASKLWMNERSAWEAGGGVYYSTAPSNSPTTLSSLPFVLGDFDIETDIVRASDGGVWLHIDEQAQNGVLLVTGGNMQTGTGLYWHTITNGGYSGTLNPTGFLFSQQEDIHLRITARGPTYSVYLNGGATAVASLTLPQARTGRVGLYDFAVQPAQSFDSFVLGVPCYANCDHSTAAPALNVQDFACFLNRFASGDPYANCDASTTAPTLNVQDFACFLNRFAAGCS